MSCPVVKTLCDNLIISQEVTFEDDTLIINIPPGSYGNNKKYCIVVAQEIPADTTIVANVVITIGADPVTQYPLLNTNGTNVTACKINTRTRYSTIVHTNIQSGVFMMLGPIKSCCGCKNAAPALPTT